MCLIALNWNPDHQYPLIMASNRDEFYARPTSKAEYWEDHHNIFGGRDQRASGTWLAVGTQGRMAAITNFRELDASGERTRGELITNFLAGDIPTVEYLQRVHNNRHLYAGFNLLLADSNALWYYSNRQDVIRQLEPGLYGLSNGLLNTPWPKVRRLKKKLRKVIDSGNITPQSCIDLLHDEKRPPDDEIPDTGVDPVWERMLAPCFIRSPNYGTRNSTGLVLERDGKLHWHEQFYTIGGEPSGFFKKTIAMPEGWLARNIAKTA
ncbi:NRDE family protein [Sansalvadorimonas sp. 2012CJ34-2]|uniref:NRDE family protein n=1 Tax=Parendozoicomonas callyspongiae TaxID=2942213 RepID=A0ABT0PIT2_9GAMM|nr:NRDE family protein [Sansalvadorimonas sp. 2012CJ34-2]MCL6270388.1 NRDE family protein [Sansalvadorimonas sp. 2012CJ34-2]